MPAQALPLSSEIVQGLGGSIDADLLKGTSGAVAVTNVTLVAGVLTITFLDATNTAASVSFTVGSDGLDAEHLLLLDDLYGVRNVIADTLSLGLGQWAANTEADFTVSSTDPTNAQLEAATYLDTLQFSSDSTNWIAVRVPANRDARDYRLVQTLADSTELTVPINLFSARHQDPSTQARYYVLQTRTFTNASLAMQKDNSTGDRTEYRGRTRASQAQVSTTGFSRIPSTATNVQAVIDAINAAVVFNDIEAVNTIDQLPPVTDENVNRLWYAVNDDVLLVSLADTHINTHAQGTFVQIAARSDLVAYTEIPVPVPAGVSAGDFGYDFYGRQFFEAQTIEGTLQWSQTTVDRALAASRSDSSYDVVMLGSFDGDNAALETLPSIAANTDYFYITPNGLQFHRLQLATYVAAQTATVDHYRYERVVGSRVEANPEAWTASLTAVETMEIDGRTFRLPQFAANPDDPTNEITSLRVNGTDYAMSVRGQAVSMGDTITIAPAGGTAHISGSSAIANLLDLGEVGARVTRVRQLFHNTSSSDIICELIIARATQASGSWTIDEIVYRTPTAGRVTVPPSAAAELHTFEPALEVEVSTLGVNTRLMVGIRNVADAEGYFVGQNAGTPTWANEFSHDAAGNTIIDGWPFALTFANRAAWNGVNPDAGTVVTDSSARPWRMLVDYEQLLPGKPSNLHRGTFVEANPPVTGNSGNLTSLRVGDDTFRIGSGALDGALERADILSAAVTFADQDGGGAKTGNLVTLTEDIRANEIGSLHFRLNGESPVVFLTNDLINDGDTERTRYATQPTLNDTTSPNALTIKTHDSLDADGFGHDSLYIWRHTDDDKFWMVTGRGRPIELDHFFRNYVSVTGDAMQQALAGAGISRLNVLSSPLQFPKSDRNGFAAQTGFQITQIAHDPIPKTDIAALFVTARNGAHNTASAVFGREELARTGYVTTIDPWTWTDFADIVPCLYFIGNPSDSEPVDGWQLRPTFEKLRTNIIVYDAPLLIAFPWESDDHANIRGFIVLTYGDEETVLETCNYLYAQDT